MTQEPEERPDLSVVIPVYNERENLRPLLYELSTVLSHLARVHEVILVDDGSTDGSAEEIDVLARESARVRAIHFPANQGQSAALDAGFRAARAPVVATLDADLQNDPADLGTLLAALEGADVACGVRIDRHDSFVRRASSRVANWIRNALTRESIRDTGCSLKVYKAPYLARIKMYRGMHRFLPTLLRLEGARVVEVPVRHRERRHGISKYGIRNRALSGLRDCLAVRWMQDRHIPRGDAEPAPEDPTSGSPHR